MMEALFDDLLELIREPFPTDTGLKTDGSVLLVYPPAQELDFREYLLGKLLATLQARAIPYRLLDLTGFAFEGLPDGAVASLAAGEFKNFRWMEQGLSQRVERSLTRRLRAAAAEIPGGNVIVHSTVALYPLLRFGEVLRELRDLPARVILAFPGEERGGKLHFMNQADGGNYLAVKLFTR